MKLCDLHTHSIYSDGTLTPLELVKTAKEEGLSAVALTDHNSVKGLSEFMALGKEFNVETVAGTEITCEYNGKEIHMLALFLTPETYRKVEDLLGNYLNAEKERNAVLAYKLNEAGYCVDYDKMQEKYGENINRVHFAKELLSLGFVTSIQNAFDTILNESAGFYTVPKRLSALDVIDFIKSINAVSVWAHPVLSLSNGEIKNFMQIAKSHGLIAVETDYSTYTDKDSDYIKSLANEFGLLYSGGSDFHGSNKPSIKLGVGKGNLKIPYKYLKQLKEVLL